ncbi:MAG: glycosyltransferase [Lachnospiraceae bacterium]|nr:glycosyltransferase [Lachnospiraceae bacterium]
MKAVHLSTTDYGGAYIAADRISRSLEGTGVDSCVIVRTKIGDASCSPYFKGPAGRFISKAKNLCNLALSSSYITTDLFGTDVSCDERIKSADVVVLHWINSFLSYKSVEKLLKSGKPLVWVMHDMWPFTGGWHYLPDGDLNEGFISSRNLKAKKKMYASGNITMVGPSRWICDEAGKSPVLSGKSIVNIPNPIDTDTYVRRDGDSLRDKYGLPKDKNIILFGAVNLDNKRKGFDLLLEAIKDLDPKKNMLCTVGNASSASVLPGEFECRNFGFVKDEDMMIDIYSLSDVYVIPSRQENLSNSVLEAMSCSLPVAAFDIGGMPDMIRSGENGYLARPYDPKDLAKGIGECLEKKAGYGEAARKYMTGEYSMSCIAGRYIELFESIVK